MNIRPKWLGNVILCNDVIKDITHKLSFIGCYVGDIVVGSFPATIKTALYVEVFGKNESTLDIYITLGGEAMGEVKAELRDPQKGMPSPLVIPGMELGLNLPGILLIEGSLDGGKRVTLVQKNIQQGEVAQF